MSPDPTFASVAGVGWNINQAMALPNPEMTTEARAPGSPSASGRYRESARLYQDETTEWCAPLPAGGSGTIPWAMFNTQCWDGTGIAFVAGTPISKVQVVLPSDAVMSRPFCICLVSAAAG